MLPPPAPPRDAEDVDQPSAYERVRDSRWFVPLLLLLLAVLLVLGAYAVGRAFTGSVGDAGRSAEHARGHCSSNTVNGPSLTRATLISAPKTPVSTCVPAARKPSQTAS